MRDFGWIQKLHSALIDVLRERYDDCLLELGLPQRIVTHSDIPPSKGVFYKPYNTPVVLIAGTEDQSSDDLAEILREALMSYSIEPGDVATYTQDPSRPSFSFKTGVWFPIHAPVRQEQFNLGVFLTS